MHANAGCSVLLELANQGCLHCRTCFFIPCGAALHLFRCLKELLPDTCLYNWHRQLSIDILNKAKRRTAPPCSSHELPAVFMPSNQHGAFSWKAKILLWSIRKPNLYQHTLIASRGARSHSNLSVATKKMDRQFLIQTESAGGIYR